MTSKFEVTITTVVKIAITDDILALHQNADWVSAFYSLDTPEKVAEHLAWNCGLHNRYLSELDGFADRSEDDVTARVVSTETEATRK